MCIWQSTLNFSSLLLPYPRMKLRLARTIKRLNVEHRTSNIEPPILMALRFIYFKLTEYIIRCWTLNVQCSMFIF